MSQITTWAEQFGLGSPQTGQNAGQEVLSEADFMANLPPGTAQNVLDTIAQGGDPVTIGIQVSVQVASAVITNAVPVASSFLSGIQQIFLWLGTVGQCTGTDCCPPGTAEDCGTDAYGNPLGMCQLTYDQVYPFEVWGWGGNAGLDYAYLPGSFGEWMSSALMSVWNAWMSKAPPGSPPPDQGGPPDVCWVLQQGQDPIAYANAQMALAFPALLYAWNQSHISMRDACALMNDVNIASDPPIWLMNLCGSVDPNDPTLGQLSVTVPSTNIDPISVAMTAMAKIAGIVPNTPIVYTPATMYTWADVGLSPGTTSGGGNPDQLNSSTLQALGLSGDGAPSGGSSYGYTVPGLGGFLLGGSSGLTGLEFGGGSGGGSSSSSGSAAAPPTPPSAPTLPSGGFLLGSGLTGLEYGGGSGGGSSSSSGSSAAVAASAVAATVWGGGGLVAGAVALAAGAAPLLAGGVVVAGILGAVISLAAGRRAAS